MLVLYSKILLDPKMDEITTKARDCTMIRYSLWLSPNFPHPFLAKTEKMLKYYVKISTVKLHEIENKKLCIFFFVIVNIVTNKYWRSCSI